MIFALGGAVLDERLHSGFSIWRASCRAAGLTLVSLLTFTVELLPYTLIFSLAGGLLVQLVGVLGRHRGRAPESLAAHAGCLLAMAVGLWLCTLPMPLPVLLGVEALLAAAAAASVVSRIPALGGATQHPGALRTCGN